MKKLDKSSKSGEYGEGNYKASKDYSDRTKKFMVEKASTIKGAAKKAAQALDSPEGNDLRRAENKARKHGRT